jgi:hypothetical protein
MNVIVLNQNMYIKKCIITDRILGTYTEIKQKALNMYVYALQVSELTVLIQYAIWHLKITSQAYKISERKWRQFPKWEIINGIFYSFINVKYANNNNENIDGCLNDYIKATNCNQYTQFENNNIRYKP